MIGSPIARVAATIALLLTSDQVHELGYSSDSALPSAVMEVRDTAAFRQAWYQLYPIASLRPALPAVDFSKWRVLFREAGEQRTGGYRLRLTSGRVSNDSILLDLTLWAPRAGCGTTSDLTHPAVAVAVPRDPVPYRVTIRARPDTGRC